MAFNPTPSVSSSVPSFTTVELVEQFLDMKLAAGLSPKTVTTYRERLQRFAAWIGQAPITRPMLVSYLADLRKQQYADATIASYFRDVRVFCSWCADEGYLPHGLTRKMSVRVSKPRPISYNGDHVTQLLAVCDERDQALIVCLLDTGLRAAEICSLDRDSIDADGHFTIIGKGNKERDGWADPYTVELIAAYLATRTDVDPAMWVGRSGQRGRLKPNGLYQMMRRRCIEAGIRGDVRRLVHAMRATFAKNYIRRGGDLESLRELLGHAGIEMSAHYARLVKDELKAQKRRINPLAAMVPQAATKS